MQNRITVAVKDRVLWIDGAKIIGIWLVVLGHMSISQDVISPIFSFHMALFFFISGYLEKHTGIKDSFKNGIRGVIIPYMLLYLLSYLWWFNISLMRHPEIYGAVSFDSAIIKPFLGMLFGSPCDTAYSTIINVPLWFLVGLFVVKLLHSLIVWVSKENINKYILFNALVVLLALIIKEMEINLIFSLDSALLALPFFSIGYLSQNGKIIVLDKLSARFKSDLLKGILIILSLATLLFLSNYNGRVDIGKFRYGRNILLFYFNGLLGILLIVCAASFYRKQNKLLTAISIGTIIILAFHIYIFEVLCKAVGMKGEGIIVNPFIAALIATITLILLIAPIMIIEKYFPILMGKKKQNITAKLSPNKKPINKLEVK